jgi:two-component system OmpR family sensor kinase
MAAAAILVALTSLVSGFLGTALLSSYLYSRSDTQLRDFAGVASSILERSHVPVAQNGQLPAQFLVESVGADGKILLEEIPPHASAGPRLSAAQLRDDDSPFTAPAAGSPGHSWRVLIVPLSGGRHAVIGFSLDDLNSTVTRLEIADALAGAVAIAVLAGLGLPLVRASLAPLGRIEATAAAIAAGDLSRRIDQRSGGTEVGRLADALDTMLGQIETAYRARADGEARALRSEDRMRQFVADASHELRTPLTSVKGLAEFGLQQGTAASPEELLRLTTLIQHEASRMGRLVEDLLLLAKFDTDRPPGPASRRSGQHRGAGGPGRPHRQPGPPDRPAGWRSGHRLRRCRTRAAGHRQPDRQCHPAHPAAFCGHRVRDQYHRPRGGHRR